MTKEQLETNIAALELLVNETFDKSTDFKTQLEQAQKQLADFNKPELTPSQFDDIYTAVDNAVEEYDFSNTDNFDIEYGIDYDGRIHCENHEMSDSGDLIDAIVENVSRLFTEAECPEDKEAEEYSDSLDKTEPDHHKPVE